MTSAVGHGSARGPRVVILANSIDELGGAQRVVHTVAGGLAERGYPVTLVGLTPAAHPHVYAARPAYRTVTLMTRSWPPPPDTSRLTSRLRPSTRRRTADRAALSAQARDGIARVLADGPPGVLVVAQLWAMEHVQASALHDWATVAQYHSSFEAAAGGRDLGRALREFADVDQFALLTAADADAFRRAGFNNTTWIPNPLTVWPEEPLDATAGRTVTYLGRLSSEKGPGFLVDAWGQVADRHPTWRLRLVGSGPDEAAVRRRIDRLPTGAERVEVVPPVEDVVGELRRAGLFVLPSLTEGLPMALAEAMACGLACVAADCSAGVRLLARYGRAAALVARGDVEALATALDGLLGDPDARARLGSSARHSVADYRLPIVLDRWEALIATALR